MGFYMFKNYFHVGTVLCLLAMIINVGACATDTPLPEPKIAVEAESAAETGVLRGSTTPKKAVSLDLSMLPDTLSLAEGEVSIQPLVLYSDQSKDAQVNISVDDSAILSLRDGVAKPLKVGKVTLFFSAVFDTNLRGSKTLTVTTEALKGAEEKTDVVPSTPKATNPPQVLETGVSAQEQKIYSAYFLKQYKVGMKWSYDVTLDGISVRAYRASLPERLNLGWGMVLDDFSAIGLDAKIEDYMGVNKQVATYTIEVVDHSAEGVVLQTELKSNSVGIPSKPLSRRHYTAENISEVYTGFLVSSASERRRTVLNNRLTIKESPHTKPAKRYLTDEIKMSASLDQGFNAREESLTWVNNQVGMVRKEVRQYGSQDDLGVTTTLVLELSALEGFE